MNSENFLSPSRHSRELSVIIIILIRKHLAALATMFVLFEAARECERRRLQSENGWCGT